MIIQVRPPHKLYALVTNQGTAASESVLTEAEYNNPETRESVEAACQPDIALPFRWEEVTDNEAFWLEVNIEETEEGDIREWETGDSWRKEWLLGLEVTSNQFTYYVTCTATEKLLDGKHEYADVTHIEHDEVPEEDEAVVREAVMEYLRHGPRKYDSIAESAWPSPQERLALLLQDAVNKQIEAWDAAHDFEVALVEKHGNREDREEARDALDGLIQDFAVGGTIDTIEQADQCLQEAIKLLKD